MIIRYDTGDPFKGAITIIKSNRCYCLPLTQTLIINVPITKLVSVKYVINSECCIHLVHNLRLCQLYFPITGKISGPLKRLLYCGNTHD